MDSHSPVWSFPGGSWYPVFYSGTSQGPSASWQQGAALDVPCLLEEVEVDKGEQIGFAPSEYSCPGPLYPPGTPPWADLLPSLALGDSASWAPPLPV